MSDLKPCPFCGGNAAETSRFDVQCSGCGAEINAAPGFAVQYWNTRADSAALAAAVQAEREACAKECLAHAGVCWRPGECGGAMRFAEFVRSRDPAPAVDVISEDFAVTMKTIATVYEERDRVLAVVREFVESIEAHERTHMLIAQWAKFDALRALVSPTTGEGEENTP